MLIEILNVSENFYPGDFRVVFFSFINNSVAAHRYNETAFVRNDMIS